MLFGFTHVIMRNVSTEEDSAMLLRFNFALFVHVAYFVCCDNKY